MSALPFETYPARPEEERCVLIHEGEVVEFTRRALLSPRVSTPTQEQLEIGGGYVRCTE